MKYQYLTKWNQGKKKREFILLIIRAIGTGSHPDGFYTFISQRQTTWCQLVPRGEGTRGHPGDRTVPFSVPKSQQLYHEGPSAARWESFSFGFHALLCSLLGPTLVFARLPTQGGNICFGWDPLFENVFLKQKQMLNILLANTSF